jgi:FkbM family methyltransferase
MLRRSVARFPKLRALIAYSAVPSGLFDRFILKYPLTPHWENRVRVACSAPDNAFISRVVNAGALQHGKQVMHNGLRIHVASYYGFEVAVLLNRNRGVHEPQEERAFQEVLKSIRPGSTMIELGAFWGFYSMWFSSAVPSARNYLVEPSPFNLKSGRKNFELNQLKGYFRQCAIGASESRMSDGTPVVSLDLFAQREGIAHVHLLHADIQGHEAEMLEGAQGLLKGGRVDWIFISTHSDELHTRCCATLTDIGYSVIAAATPGESFSEDGVIVACRADISAPPSIQISRKS